MPCTPPPFLFASLILSFRFNSGAAASNSFLDHVTEREDGTLALDADPDQRAFLSGLLAKNKRVRGGGVRWLCGGFVPSSVLPLGSLRMA